MNSPGISESSTVARRLWRNGCHGPRETHLHLLQSSLDGNEGGAVTVLPSGGWETQPGFSGGAS